LENYGQVFKHLLKIFYKIMAGVLGGNFGSFLAPAEHFLQNHQTENHGRSFGPKFWAEFLAARVVHLRIIDRLSSTCRRFSTKSWPEFWAKILG